MGRLTGMTNDIAGSSLDMFVFNCRPINILGFVVFSLIIIILYYN